MPISKPKSGEEGEGEGNDKGEPKIEEEPVKTEEEQERILELEAEQAAILDVAINTDQVAQELRNLEMMFNGEMAPDMNAFENMLNVISGGEALSGNERPSVDADPSMAGNYIMTSCQYRDEKLGISMDIGHMRKLWDGELEYTTQDGGVMSVKGIKFDPAAGKITFAFKNGENNVLLSSDLNSIQEYAAQKKIEEIVHLQVPLEGPKIDLDLLLIAGLEEQPAETSRFVASCVIDFLPFVGTVKGVTELIFGYDYIGGEDVSRVISACGLVVSWLPAGELAVKMTGRFIAKVPGMAAKVITYVKPARFAHPVVGRQPAGLAEELAMMEAQSGRGKPFEMKKPIGDPKYQAPGWGKIQHEYQLSNKEKINIHYMKNRLTGEVDQFKFKSDPYTK